jgi:hypothetical protein
MDPEEVELDDLYKALSSARNLLDVALDDLASDEEATTEVRSAREIVSAIRRRVADVSPLRGSPLKEKEWYFALSQGTFTLSSGEDTVGSYGLYKLLYYDGDERSGLIDTRTQSEKEADEKELQKRAEEKGAKKLVPLISKTDPENVKVRHLTEEQIEYFEEQRPDLYDRFDKD